jgi:drug/metabolite transporter (DMT)-like permease
MRFSDRDPLDPGSAFEEDRLILGIASGAAMMAIALGAYLIATGLEGGGWPRPAAGALLCVGAVAGFGCYWRRI